MIDFADFSNLIRSVLARNSIKLKVSDGEYDEIIVKLFSFTEILLTANRYMNLTAITDPAEIALLHYADSLTLLPILPEKPTEIGFSMIDVGCGAGFPAVPIAIACPWITVTALDATAKRVDFIRQAAGKIGITNLIPLHARAETAAHDPRFREKYDLSCARAVAKLPVLCELCLPYVKPGGKFAAMKARVNEAEDIIQAEGAARILGGGEMRLREFDLFPEPLNTEHNIGKYKRTIVIIEKIGRFEKIYPRNNSQITKKPLG